MLIKLLMIMKKNNKELQSNLLQTIDIVKEKDLALTELRDKIDQNKLNRENNQVSEVQHNNIIEII